MLCVFWQMPLKVKVELLCGDQLCEWKKESSPGVGVFEQDGGDIFWVAKCAFPLNLGNQGHPYKNMESDGHISHVSIKAKPLLM